MPKDIWITAGTAAKLLEERLGRPIRVDYVTRLGMLGRIRKQDMGSRIVLYHRHDVEQVQIRERKKPSAEKPIQTELPLAQMPENAPVQEKLIDDTSTSQNRNVAQFEDMPPGTMKRGELVETYKLNNAQFGKWLEHGLGDDRLEVTYYISFPNKKKSACFTPEQITHNLEVLRKHGKIKQRNVTIKHLVNGQVLYYWPSYTNKYVSSNLLHKSYPHGVWQNVDKYEGKR